MEKMTEAITYYCQLIDQLNALAGERTGQPEWGRFTNFNFTRDRVDVVCELLANLVVGLISFAIFFLPSINRDNRVQEFKYGEDFVNKGRSNILSIDPEGFKMVGIDD
ncbi:hypothetical protein [Acetobacterium wieringae]|nr:hypothetical protein [Acetobacterium wieringae]MEA4805810.1 hypothetical protein [Acetobacterium wieringae]